MDDRRPKPQYDRVPAADAGDGTGEYTNQEQVDCEPSQPSLANWQPLSDSVKGIISPDTMIDCGWGRLLFGHTFSNSDTVAEVLCQEDPGKRDIALYIRDPHVVLAKAPHELFLDPSHTFRATLADLAQIDPGEAVTVRQVSNEDDAVAINGLYACHHMAPIDPVFIWQHREDPVRIFLVAVDPDTDRVVGCVTGIDHVSAFNDPEDGSSLWTLAVHPDARQPGIGKALILHLAKWFHQRGRTFMDLSVLAENEAAIRLYRKLGFERVPVFCIKHKHNPINEDLYVAPDQHLALNPYARIITDEARRRGIAVEVLDAERGYFRLTFGGRSVTCRESLTTLTSAIAMSRCSDKALTCQILNDAGLRVPQSIMAGSSASEDAFLAEHGSVVVKPLVGEQGQGIAVDIRTPDELRIAVARAKAICSDVLVEEHVPGHDLRILVIGDEVVAAALRRPPVIVGDGRLSVRDLIDRLSRRRSAATGGESTIPLDEETARTIHAAGYNWDSILPQGDDLAVRKTANLHTGGILEDVTNQLNPVLTQAAIRAARALEIPVTGLDLLVPDPAGEAYVIIEANERPGLANHEPNPTAERFIDLLFPRSAPRSKA